MQKNPPKLQHINGQSLDDDDDDDAVSSDDQGLGKSVANKNAWKVLKAITHNLQTYKLPKLIKLQQIL